MSVASSSVYKRVELEPGIYSRMTKAIETAIQQAIHATIGRIEAYAKSGASNVPVDTGLLRDSFTATATAQGITLRWSAVDKGYDYAKVQDIGDMKIRGKFYSTVTKDYARLFFHEELIRALEAINP